MSGVCCATAAAAGGAPVAPEEVWSVGGVNTRVLLELVPEDPDWSNNLRKKN